MRTTDSRPLRLTIFAAWIVLVAILVASHVLWRDEMRALSLALEGEGVGGMLGAIRGEGHPLLWYAMLRAAHAVTGTPMVLPALAVMVALAAAALLVLRSPFRAGTLVLLLAGYFLAFEYSVLARNYGISVLLLFLFATLYPKYRDRGLALGAILFLLANTNVHSVVLAGALFAFWSVDALGAERAMPAGRVRVLTLNGMLFVAGIALCASTVYVPDRVTLDASPVATAATGAAGHAGRDTLRALARAVIIPADQFQSLAPIDEFRGVLRAAGLPGRLVDDVPRLLLDVLLFGATLGLIRRRGATAAAIVALIALSVLFQFLYPGYLRHQGLWVMFLATLYWIAGTPREGEAPVARGPVADRVVTVGTVLFVVLLALQVPATVREIGDVLRGGPPYSRSRDLARLVDADPSLRGAVIMADPDYVLDALPYYLGNPLYRVREVRFGAYTRWGGPAARRRLDLRDLHAEARRVRSETGRPVVLALRETLDPDAAPRVWRMPALGYTRTTPDQVRDFLADTRLLARLRPARSNEEYDVYVLR